MFTQWIIIKGPAVVEFLVFNLKPLEVKSVTFPRVNSSMIAKNFIFHLDHCPESPLQVLTHHVITRVIVMQLRAFISIRQMILSFLYLKPLRTPMAYKIKSYCGRQCSAQAGPNNSCQSFPKLLPFYSQPGPLNWHHHKFLIVLHSPYPCWTHAFEHKKHSKLR